MRIVIATFLVLSGFQALAQDCEREVRQARQTVSPGLSILMALQGVQITGVVNTVRPVGRCREMLAHVMDRFDYNCELAYEGLSTQSEKTYQFSCYQETVHKAVAVLNGAKGSVEFPKCYFCAPTN